MVYQLPSSFSGGIQGAVESLKKGILPQPSVPAAPRITQEQKSFLPPKPVDKKKVGYVPLTKEQFMKARDAGFSPDKILEMEEMRKKQQQTGEQKIVQGLTRFQKAPGENIRQSIIQSGKEMGKALVQPIVGLGKGLYKGATDVADLADLKMEKAPEDRGIIQNTLANIGTGIKDYATADLKAFQENPGIKTAFGMYNPISENKLGAAARVVNRGIGDAVGGAMETVLTPEAQQTVGTVLSPAAKFINKGLSYVPEGNPRDILEATLNLAPIKIPGVKTALGKVSKTVGDIKLPKSTPGNIDDYVLKTYEKGVRPSVTSAKKPMYKDNVVGAVKTITENKPNLKLLDEFGEETGKLPQTLREFTQAIDQTKKSIFDEYDSLQKKAGGKGAEVKLTTVADELQKVANDPVIIDTNPAIADYAQKASERFLERGKYTTQQAQDAIKSYNTSLEAFYKNPSYETASKAAIDAMIVNNMRKGLDDAIESLGGKGYQALKNKYGSVKSIEKDVVNRAIVDGRKNAKGLLDFTDVFSGAEVIRGILTLNPATFATGVGASLIKTYYKYLNNPNTSIKKLFKTTEKSYLPSPKSQPASNIAPIPTKMPSNVPIKEKVSLPIIQKTEVKATESKLPKPKDTLEVKEMGGTSTGFTKKSEGVYEKKIGDREIRVSIGDNKVYPNLDDGVYSVTVHENRINPDGTWYDPGFGQSGTSGNKEKIMKFLEKEGIDGNEFFPATKTPTPKEGGVIGLTEARKYKTEQEFIDALKDKMKNSILPDDFYPKDYELPKDGGMGRAEAIIKSTEESISNSKKELSMARNKNRKAEIERSIKRLEGELQTKVDDLKRYNSEKNSYREAMDKITNKDKVDAVIKNGQAKESDRELLMFMLENRDNPVEFWTDIYKQANKKPSLPLSSKSEVKYSKPIAPTVNDLRKALKEGGLEQYKTEGLGKLGQMGTSGDFSVKDEVTTTFSRLGKGYKTHRKSTPTGYILIEKGNGMSLDEATLKKIKEVLDERGIDYIADTSRIRIKK